MDNGSLKLTPTAVQIAQFDGWILPYAVSAGHHKIYRQEMSHHESDGWSSLGFLGFFASRNFGRTIARIM
jgi:hypothetical protein